MSYYSINPEVTVAEFRLTVPTKMLFDLGWTFKEILEEFIETYDIDIEEAIYMVCKTQQVIFTIEGRPDQLKASTFIQAIGNDIFLTSKIIPVPAAVDNTEKMISFICTLLEAIPYPAASDISSDIDNHFCNLFII